MSPYSRAMRSFKCLIILVTFTVAVFCTELPADSERLLLHLNSPAPTERSNFGFRVQLDGNLVAVSERRRSQRTNLNGYVHIFSAIDGDLITTIQRPNRARKDFFGTSIALHGKMLVVGDYRETIDGVENIGQVYVFDALSGEELQVIKNPNSIEWERFGISVALDENYIIVGADQVEPEEWKAQGAVYVYSHEGELLKKLDPPSNKAKEGFGFVVDIDRDVVAIGKENPNYQYSYLFALTDQSWTELKNPRARGSERYGMSLSIAEGYVAIGASEHDAGGLEDSGIVHIFETRSANLHRSVVSPVPKKKGRFGKSLTVNKDFLVVGNLQSDNESIDIYNTLTGVHLGSVPKPNDQGNTNFGRALAISGNRVVVGAPAVKVQGEINAGAAYLYEIISSSN